MLSRCDIFELSATNEEVIDLMRCVAGKGFRGISFEECESVIDFIGEHADDRQLSMRLLGSSLRKYQYSREEGLDWRPLVETQLHNLGMKQAATRRLDLKARDVRILKDAIAKFPDSPKDQMEYFCAKSQKSKATFYRVLAQYRDEIGE